MGPFAAVLLIVGFFALVYFVQKASTNKLKQSGTIIDRQSGFERDRETYTMKNADWDTVKSKLSEQDYTGTDLQKLKWIPDENLIGLIGGGNGFSWVGVMEFKGMAAGRCIWTFEFERYKADNDHGKSLEWSMNAIKTKVEKMLLTIDPDTMVETERKVMKHTTKTKFF